MDLRLPVPAVCRVVSMNKPHLCVLMFLLAAFSIPAYANIGDNAAQMEGRYGAVQAEKANEGDGLTTKCYSHGGFWIRARFLNGSSQSEAFIRVDKNVLSSGEITSLLDANKVGSNWKGVFKNKDLERWILASNGAVAQYYSNEHILLITTKDLMKYIAEKSRLVEKP